MQRILRDAAALTVVALAAGWSHGSAQAQDPYQEYGPTISSYNYYVGGGWPAQMYPCPRPVPAYVGHTYITYEPLAPHNFLYRHRRVYSGPAGIPNQPRVTVLWW